MSDTTYHPADDEPYYEGDIYDHEPGGGAGATIVYHYVEESDYPPDPDSELDRRCSGGVGVVSRIPSGCMECCVVRSAEAEAIAVAGGEPARELVLALLEQVAQVAQLVERVEELERRLSRTRRTARCRRRAIRR